MQSVEKAKREKPYRARGSDDVAGINEWAGLAMFVAPPVSEPKSFQFALTVMDRAWPGGVRKATFLPSCERV